MDTLSTLPCEEGAPENTFAGQVWDGYNLNIGEFVLLNAGGQIADGRGVHKIRSKLTLAGPRCGAFWSVIARIPAIEGLLDGVKQPHEVTDFVGHGLAHDRDVELRETFPWNQSSSTKILPLTKQKAPGSPALCKP